MNVEPPELKELRAQHREIGLKIREYTHVEVRTEDASVLAYEIPPEWYGRTYVGQTVEVRVQRWNDRYPRTLTAQVVSLGTTYEGECRMVSRFVENTE